MISSSDADVSLRGLNHQSYPIFNWEGQIRFHFKGHVLLMNGEEEAFKLSPSFVGIEKMIIRITHHLGDPLHPNPDAQIVEITINPHIFAEGHFALLSDNVAFMRFMKKLDEIIEREEILKGILW